MIGNTEELALPGKMSFAFPAVITEGTAKCYIVNKQRNGMERFLAAPAPLAVEDENFVEAENGNEPAAPVAAPSGETNKEPPFKVSALFVAILPRSPLIIGSGDSGSYSGPIRN